METDPNGRAVRILLVDDQSARLLSYEAILRDLGHELVRAGSGSEALEQLLAGEFALILLDVSMPGMDGFELAALVRDHPRFEKTPIIFVTGLHMTDIDRLKGYSLGAVDYVHVPVVPEILRSKVSVLTELYLKRRELRELNRSLEQANTELHAANTSLQAEKTRELEAANAQLARANCALQGEVDERRRLENALLETARRKDEFLAMLAHELRNPLAPILNGVHFLRLRDLDDPELAWCRDMIGRQTEQLTRLVDELLDVSRINLGKIRLQPARLALDAVVFRAVETNRPLIEARGQQLSVELPPEPVHVRGDLTRLAQVVGNLLNNAAKFTEEGGSIRLAVEVARRPDGLREAQIRVRDTGVGIPPEMLPRVFELFTQVERPVSGSEGGLGIGLALVRHLVELHGGRVEARSPSQGGGSEFIVSLPLLEGAAEPEQQSPAGAAPACERRGDRPRQRVLVVDDNHDSAHSMGLLLGELGHEVRLAFAGREGLRAVAEFQPQLVFLDIGMPGMDGYEVARRIRELRRPSPITLVALTGFGQAEDRRRTQAAGFDLHLVKPVAREDVDRLFGEAAVALRPPESGPAARASRSAPLRQVAHDLRTPLNALWTTIALLLETPLDARQREYAGLIRRSAEALRQLADELGGAAAGARRDEPVPAAQLGVAPARALRILVVDDDPISRVATLRLVAALGHACEPAAGGREALTANERRPFDVVLMDLQMQGMSGAEAARRMRRNPGKGARPRILGLTGSSLAVDREACRSAGMEAVLLKPVEPGTLRAALEGQDDARSSQPLDPRSEGRPALAEFRRLYAADTPRQLARLRQAAERGDAAELAQIAHRLAGSSSTVGAKLLGSLAARLEALARAGDAPGSAALVADLERAWPATREALAAARAPDAAAPTS